MPTQPSASAKPARRPKPPPEAPSRIPPRLRAFLKWSAIATSILTVLALIGAVVLWLMLPSIIESRIRDELPKVEEKLNGRKLDFERIELNGFQHVTIIGLVMYQLNSDVPLATIDAVDIELSDNPLRAFDDFKVSSVEITAPRLTLHQRADGSFNTDDLRERLEAYLNRPKAKKKKKKKKKKSAFDRYFKPFPPITVTNAALVIKADSSNPSRLPLHSLEGLNVELKKGTQPDAPYEFDASFELSYQLPSDRKVRKKQLALQGHWKNKKDARFSLDLGLGGDFYLPMVSKEIGHDVRLGRVALELPHTLTLYDLAVSGPAGDFDAPLLRTDSLEMWVFEFPPTKVRDILVKEATFSNLEVNLLIEEDGRPEIQRVIEEAIARRPKKRKISKGAKITIGRLMRAAWVGGVRKWKKRRSPKIWYEYCQRIFISDAVVNVITEQTQPPTTIALHDFNLVYGWRFLRGRAEFELDFLLDESHGGRLYGNGVFAKKEKKLDVQLQLDGIPLSPFAALLERGLRKVPGLKRALPLDEVVLHTEPLHPERQETSPYLNVALNLKTWETAIEGNLRFKGLHIYHPRLSTYPLDGLDVGVGIKASYHPQAQLLDVPRLQVSSGGAVANLDMTLSPLQFSAPYIPKTAQFHVALKVPPQDAQVIIESIPYGLRNKLDGLQLEGTYQFELDLEGSVEEIAAMKVNPQVTLSSFAVRRWPAEANISGLNKGISRLKLHDPKAVSPHYVNVAPSIYEIKPLRRKKQKKLGFADRGGFDPRHTAADLERHHPNWVPFDNLSEWMIQMITSTEDGDFFFHKGFSFFQMTDAVADALLKGKPLRGASTISMQLIKNAFLGRERSISRKFQEILLTWLMESVARIPKRRILEVYFNLIEFGPELYGLGPAALHYFGKYPVDLSLREAGFLALVIPSPRERHEHWENGAVSRRMSNRVNAYIRKMYKKKCNPEKIARMKRRGRTLPFERRCPDAEELGLLLEDPIAFYKPGPRDQTYNPEYYDEKGRRLYPNIMGTTFGPNPEEGDPFDDDDGF